MLNGSTESCSYGQSQPGASSRGINQPSRLYRKFFWGPRVGDSARVGDSDGDVRVARRTISATAIRASLPANGESKSRRHTPNKRIHSGRLCGFVGVTLQ
jgi:hypothetical protein